MLNYGTFPEIVKREEKIFAKNASSKETVKNLIMFGLAFVPVIGPVAIIAAETLAPEKEPQVSILENKV